MRKLPALEMIYRRAEERRLPVMFHTGTSIFPGARNIYGDPIHLDEVAVDCPGMTIVMAHGGRRRCTAAACRRRDCRSSGS